MHAEPSPKLVLRESSLGPYRLRGVLGEGGMGIVYRAEHQHTGEVVALKTVRVPHAKQLESIRREIFALGSIRHRGVVQILDEGVSDGVPWYAMELLKGETLSAYLRKAWSRPSRPPPEEVETQAERPRFVSAKAVLPALPELPRSQAAAGQLEYTLGLVRRLCVSLAFLHGEGIVHRDLKSANVFLCTDGSPVLIDFGLVWRTPGPHAREVLDVSSGAAGTAGYMAPEQLLGEPVDARTDLYAVGCILYEILTGRLPFTGRDVTHKLTAAPMAPSHRVEGVPSELDELVLRLLDRRPRHRVAHADDIVHALDDLLSSSDRTRTSTPARAYVYLPEIAGREEVLALLGTQLERAERTEGSCVVLSGESGIGKTCVATTFARTASARGFQVVTCACLPLGAEGQRGRAGDAPLHPFVRFFQAVADRCLQDGVEVTERLLGPRGKVLSALNPAFRSLPGQEAYPEPPELPAAGARERLLRCVEETLGAYAGEGPLLLIVDDIQWADELTLRFLDGLSQAYFLERQLLVLATYRSEETTEALATLGARPHVIPVELGRLSVDALCTISAGMLGLEAPLPPFVRRIATMAEGNPFLAGEYLRAAVDGGLAQRDPRGRWHIVSEDGELPLPNSLGDLVHRRLEGFGEGARKLLQAAAVLGNEMDAELLSLVCGEPLANLRGALRDLLTRQVLEETPSELGQLRFLHGKLRDFAYEATSPARRCALHLAAATALRARAEAAGMLGFHSPKLAHHYTEAGETEGALHFLELAGEQAMSRFANEDAIRFFRQALHLDVEAPGDGAAHLRRGRWERRLGDAYFAVGDLEATHAHVRKALAWLGQPAPTSALGWAGVLLRDAPLQVLHRLAPRAFTLPQGDARERAREAANAMQRLAFQYYFAYEAVPMLGSSLRAVNLAERAGDVRAAPTYGMLGMVVGIGKLPALARVYLKTARDVARTTGDRDGLVFSLFNEAVWRIGEAGWKDVQALCEEALSCGEASPLDPNDVAIARTMLAHIDFYTGQFAASKTAFDAIAQMARVHKNPQHVAWGLYASARAMIPLGQFEEARRMLEEAHTLLEQLEVRGDAASRIICPGLLAVASWEVGKRERALEMARLAAERSRWSVPSVFSTVSGYAGVVEVFLEAGDREAAERALRRHLACAAALPLARPSYYRLRAQKHAMDGRTGRARAAFARAVRSAEALNMPYEEALAHLAWARNAADTPLERRAHAAKARTLFEALESPRNLGEARSLENH